MYQQAITISYNGNSATSGNVSSQTGTAYRNYAGTIVGATFTLAANGFTRTSYIFTDWAMGSASGTKYAAGASVTLTANTTFYAYWISDQYSASFSYTGSIQTFTAPVAGTYKLTVYGAKGGGNGGYGDTVGGGLGGYSYGNVLLTKGQTLYVVVGSRPESVSTEHSGGYNGGATATCGGGGGATHIAKRTGLLSSLSSYKSDILIVAGGGGGAGWYGSNSIQGGAGGGTTGGNGLNNGKPMCDCEVDMSLYYSNASGGTQTSGGAGGKYGWSAHDCDGTWVGAKSGAASSGSFGAGGSSTYNTAGGGGGGYYGGGGGCNENGGYSSGAGGSGYVGGCISGTTGMSSGANSGNGSASIALVSVA